MELIKVNLSWATPIVNKSPVMWQYSSNPGGSIKPGGSWNIDGSLKPKKQKFSFS